MPRDLLKGIGQAFKQTGDAGQAVNDMLIKVNQGEATQEDLSGLMTSIQTGKFFKGQDLRSTIDTTVDEVVDEFWEGDENFKNLLKETAAHEAHYGKLDKVNPMRVDPIQREEMKKSKYQAALGQLGARRTKEGDFDSGDLRTNIVLSAMKYVTHPKWKYGIEEQTKRAQVWKDLYNTDAGKGTPEKYLKSLELFDMREK